MRLSVRIEVDIPDPGHPSLTADRKRVLRETAADALDAIPAVSVIFASVVTRRNQ